MSPNGSIAYHSGWHRLESIFMSQTNLKEHHNKRNSFKLRENQIFPAWMNDLIGEMESEYHLIESELVCR